MTDEQDFAWSFHEEAYKQAMERVAEISEFRSLRAEKPSELDIQKERVKNAQSGLDEIIKGLAADASVPRRMIEEIREYRAAAELVGPPAESQALSAPPVDPSPHPAFLIQIELSCVQAEQEPAPELVSQAQAKVEQAPPHEPPPAPATTALAEPEQRPTEQSELTVTQVKTNPALASTAQVVEQPHVDAQIEPAQSEQGVTPRPRKRRKTWKDVAWEYVVQVQRKGRYRTCKDLFNALENKGSEQDAPITKGPGDKHRGKLFVVEISESYELKTFQNAWPEIQEAADSK